jgi:hypothetical protein
VTKHVASALMLSGIDPNNDMQGSIDGSTIYRTVDMSHSLFLDPGGYNAMLGSGKPRHISNSSAMIAFREAAVRKAVTCGEQTTTALRLFSRRHL